MKKERPIIKTKMLPGYEITDDGHGNIVLRDPPSVPWPSKTEAAAALGRLGGSVTGKTKARSSGKMRAAANTRWKTKKK